MGQEEVIRKGWHREAREEKEKQKTVEGKSRISRKCTDVNMLATY